MFERLQSQYLLALAIISQMLKVTTAQNASLPATMATQLITPQDFPGAPAACSYALLATVNCPQSVLLKPLGRRFANDELFVLCTSTCTQSLNDWRSSVVSACQGWNFVDNVSNITYVPTALGDYRIYGYQLACLKDSSGAFCDSHYVTQPTDDSDFSIPQVHNSTLGECDECNIRSLQAQLNSYFGYDDDTLSDFKSLTQSCQSPTYTLTPTTPIVLNPTTTDSPEPTVTCSGVQYQIKQGDTCASISLSQKISTSAMLRDNDLMGSCTNFPTSGTLCIQNTCNVYTVQQNDTCSSISLSQNVDIQQIISWNIELNSKCSTLDRLVGYQICLSNPLGNYTLPSVTGRPSVSPTAPVPVPDPIAPNSTINCGSWYEIHTNDQCALVANKFGISLFDFYFLNPMLDANCTNLWNATYYCVEAVGDIKGYSGYPGGTGSIVFPSVDGSWVDWTTATPVGSAIVISPTPTTNSTLAPATRKDCAKYLDMDRQYYDASIDCSFMASLFSVTMEQFTNWNPSLSQNGTDTVSCKLQPGYIYCSSLSPPAPIVLPDPSTIFPPIPDNAAPGAVSPCRSWMELDGSPGQDCAFILTNSGINITQFYNWNPSIGPDCRTLQLHTAYCVEDATFIPNFPMESKFGSTPTPTTTTTNAPSATAPTPPAETRPGQVANCDGWHVMGSTDTCSSIFTNANISFDTFYAWNPTIGAQCGGLWPSYAYCIHISS